VFSNAFFEEICFPLEADHFHPFEWVANFVVSLVAEYQRNEGMKVYIGIEYCLCRNKFMSLTTSLNCSPVAISSLVIDISSLGSSYLSKSSLHLASITPVCIVFRKATEAKVVRMGGTSGVPTGNKVL